MSMIDRAISVGVRAGICVGDRYAPKRLPRHFARRLSSFQPELVPKRVVLVGVAVRPPIYSNGTDVPHRIETSRATTPASFPPKLPPISSKCVAKNSHP